ncbi:MAG: hypothetical protein JNL81_05355 [Hyphomonadaceae bacterium]|nr:hypothetical protein [Hyphomonadaceae bacterium]
MTVCERPDGTFEIYLNEEARELVVRELQRLDKSWDHFHLDHFEDAGMEFATDVPLRATPYNEGDKVFKSGKVLLRPDDWDAEHFPHVMPRA